MLRRPRRNRKSEAIRSAIKEHCVEARHLVLPLFLVDGSSANEVIPSLRMASRMSIDHTLKHIERAMKVGLDKFILFPAVADELKTKDARYSYDTSNFYLKAANTIKVNFPECCLISDVAMDPYSSDGHDGYVVDGQIDNDLTLPILARMSVAQAEAGFDMLGPSDMMDGRVAYIREALDEAGFVDTSIMSYTAKYASAMYGPFRDALDSAPKSGDKKTYQMDPANSTEALIEAELDEIEGADILMVKPALHYLDIVRRLKDSTALPIAAYHVSGECAMLQAACDKGWLDYDKAMPETLLSIRRAGADFILTYFALDFAERFC